MAQKKPAAQPADDMLARPADVSSGEFIKLQDLEGCLLVLQATDTEVKTEVFENGPAEYIEGRCLVVEGANELADQWWDLWIFPVVVRNKVRHSHPRPIVGVLGHGEATKKGRNAPWVLEDPTEEQYEKARQAFVKAEAGF